MSKIINLDYHSKKIFLYLPRKTFAIDVNINDSFEDILVKTIDFFDSFSIEEYKKYCGVSLSEKKQFIKEVKKLKITHTEYLKNKINF